MEIHFVLEHFLFHADEFHCKGLSIGAGGCCILYFADKPILNLALVSAAIEFVAEFKVTIVFNVDLISTFIMNILFTFIRTANFIGILTGCTISGV